MRIDSRRLLRYAALGSTFLLLLVLSAACGNAANSPSSPGLPVESLAVMAPLQSSEDLPVPPSVAYPTPAPTPVPSPTPVRLNGPVTAALAANMPEAYAAPLLAALAQIESVTAANGVYPVRVLDQSANAGAPIQFVRGSSPSSRWRSARFAVVVLCLCLSTPSRSKTLRCAGKAGKRATCSSRVRTQPCSPR